LRPNTTYYAAVWSGDGSVNFSAISNTPSVLTLASPPAPSLYRSGLAAALVLGQADFASFGAASSQRGLNLQYGSPFSALDASGNLWVADYNNNRVLEYQQPFSNGMNAALVLGQSDFSTIGAA